MKSHAPEPPLADMPALYFERTTEAERERHAQKVARLGAGTDKIIDLIEDDQGGFGAEIVTTDWDEPGLLDRIFEAFLRCIGVPGGVAVRRARIFTSAGGHVVNVFELTDRQGMPLKRDNAELVVDQLCQIQPGERGVLQTIEHLPFTSFIPVLTDLPAIDNGRSEDFSFLHFQVPYVSNRFTSVLLHFLARSELWLNVRVAEFRQGDAGTYDLYVLDKHGAKLKDSHFNRLNLVRALEAMNRMLDEFNVSYVLRDWNQRIDGNEKTIYQSRPHPPDFLHDLENIRQLARIRGFSGALSELVRAGLLEQRSFYFLKKVETFVEHNRARFKEAVEGVPDAEAVELFREYFELRRKAVRILMPLFDRLLQTPSVHPVPSDQQRLHTLAKPFPQSRFALDRNRHLYLSGTLWLEEPGLALDPLLLTARTGCFLREDTKEAVEAALEGWTDSFIAENRAELGRKFLTLIDESLRQGNTAIVLRNARALGLLQRYVPGFDEVRGLVHTVADHRYTVDEHSIVAIEAMGGLSVLREALPRPGKSAMRRDYEGLESAAGLQNFSRKYASELRMLQTIPQVRSHPATKPFFKLMEDVRTHSLEYLVEMNLLEYGYSLCMDALVEIEGLRRELDRLVRLFCSLPLREQRNLVLVGLLHDIKKPALNHPELGAAALADILEAMGLPLEESDVARIRWLIEKHVAIHPLMNQLGSEGEAAVQAFVAEAGDPSLVVSLVLFTYADRVALGLSQNKNTHDAMVLTQMLELLPWAPPPRT